MKIEGKNNMHFSGSYAPDDVEILLKPVEIAPTGVQEKEELIQSGAKHYSEMLSDEAVPDLRYMDLYREALTKNASRLRGDIAILSEQIASLSLYQANQGNDDDVVLISLARAGTPIGVLLHRDLKAKGVKSYHYSVSIIRDRGIDEEALKTIRSRHKTKTVIFVDGWTGKGAIAKELATSLKASDTGFKPFLAVVADPAGCADLAATTEDYVIPSGLLNGIVSGLISRSVLNDDHVGAGDYHACRFMQHHAEHDLSSAFIDAIERASLPILNPDAFWSADKAKKAQKSCQAMLKQMLADNDLDDVNRIKPGIAEATRAVLRRVPHKVYVAKMDDPEIAHLIYLANENNVPVEQADLGNYRAVTIIKTLGGSQE